MPLTFWTQKCQAGTSLTEPESQACLTEIFKGKVSTKECVALLNALAAKGESVSEIVGFAKSMREHAVPVQLTKATLDTCGTGGSGQARFNGSTAAAFVLAACGVPVAKHGNRGSHKPNGSFDFLEALNLTIDWTPQQQESIFQKTNLCFLFARAHHPAMKYVAEARKAIPTRTIFNLLGPLCNPASPAYQVIGTIGQEQGQKLAEAIQRLGIRRALISINPQGIDEFSSQSPNTVWEVTREGIQQTVWDPSGGRFSQEKVSLSGTAEENARWFKDILKNQHPGHPIEDQLAVNAGAGLYCVGKTGSIEEGVSIAREAIRSGAVEQQFLAYVAIAGKSVK